TVVYEKWSVTKDAFERLLNWLDADREQAALKYESLRRRLIEYFAKRQCAAAEDLTDEVLNCVVDHLNKRTSLLLDKPLPYIFGIARNIYRHYVNQQLRVDGEAEPHRLPDRHDSEESWEKEQISQCLHQCLRRLKEDERQTLVLYYLKSTTARDEHRLRLAERLGCTINALRLKMMRLRDQLRSCITSCQHSASR
ncbi:MAG: sigma-70 family RNA polymerase sigma factor, partial [Acidobacteriota bacterium]|nr:sigma-70 family RNA polymerase sigma factor [Acidobacteriota bacterium]